MNAIGNFFSSSGFMPHGFCLLWRPDILALHAISDLVIAAAYFSIPLAILYFVRRRADLAPEHKRVAVLFGVFILGCGMTHVMSIVVLWRPFYVEDGLIKAFTAVVSLFTAVALWPMLPSLLAIPSPGQLADANASLQAEISAKEAALGELRAIRAGLEHEVARRTEEVQALARRFEIAMEGSSITVSEQDDELRYTWLNNPRTSLPFDPIGHTDEEVLGGVTSMLATIEVVSSRFAQWPRVERLCQLADLQNHGAIACGQAIDYAPAFDCASPQLSFTFNGANIAPAQALNPAGDPRRLLGWLVNHCAARGLSIGAGIVVTTGSYTGLHFPDSPGTAVGEFRGLPPVRLTIV